MTAQTFDLLIVGAGPAGSAAALAALTADPTATVAMVDRADFPRDKVCGDGLTPAAVQALAHLGVSEVLDGYAPVARLAVTGPSGTGVVVRAPSTAYVVPRRVLDARLVRAAIGRGAQLLEGRATDLTREGGQIVINGRWAARCVVGADGANSTVRAALGLARHPDRHTGVALRGYTHAPPGPARMEVRFVSGRLWPAYAWTFTDGAGTANVGVGTFDATTRPTRRELVGLLTDHLGTLAPEPAQVSGHRLPLSTGGRRLGVGRVLLVGDAAGLVDSLTGEGIHLALISGMLAGHVAVTAPRGPVAAYRRALRRRLGQRLALLRLAARAYRDPVRLDALITTAADRPAVAHALTAAGLGDDHLRTWATIATAAFALRGPHRHDQPPATHAYTAGRS